MKKKHLLNLPRLICFGVRVKPHTCARGTCPVSTQDSQSSEEELQLLWGQTGSSYWWWWWLKLLALLLKSWGNALLAGIYPRPWDKKL